MAPLGVAGMVACGATTPDVSPMGVTAPAPRTTTTADPIAAAATIDTGTTAIGTVLTDHQGDTLYYVSTEANGEDACSTAPGCALMWPALAPPTDGTPVAGEGVGGALGMITAADGSSEVTYNGWPVHTFSGEGAGKVTGQGNASFGGTWSVATPDMAPISSSGGVSSLPGLATPVGLASPPGGLPTNPFAPTTPAGTPVEPPLPTISSGIPTDPP